MRAATRSSFSGVRPVSTGIAPSSASASAAASPMPLPAPVMHAIFPASLGIVVSLVANLRAPHWTRLPAWAQERRRIMAIVLNDEGELSVAATDGLWLSAEDAARATGWTLKPEGMCRDEFCVPLPATSARDGRVDAAAFWQLLGRPVVHDAANDTWV